MRVIIWVVYENPLDFPGLYVARKFIAGESTQEHYTNTDLNNVRDWVKVQLNGRGQGVPTRINRHQNDDPCILEMWV